MSWFRRKAPQVLDAEHLLQETAEQKVAGLDVGAVTQVEKSNDAPPAASADFRLTVSDVFVIHGRGTVATGQVESGSLSVGAEVAVSRDGQVVRRVRVTGVEMFRKTLDIAVPGQNVGLLLDRTSREDVAAGDVLTG